MTTPLFPLRTEEILLARSQSWQIFATGWKKSFSSIAKSALAESFCRQNLAFFHQFGKKSQSELFLQLKTKSGMMF